MKMAVVEMKCPNCGGKMGLTNNQFMCPNCRTMVLNIMDAKIDADVTVMSPDEFAKKIEESKRQFVVNINDNIQVFDVQTRIINKKIADASLALEHGEYEQVGILLKDVPTNIFSAERLRYLAEFRARNEYELSSYNGYIDVEKRRYTYGGTYNYPHARYQNIIELADEQTKATYKKIAEYCREQFDTKNKIKNEINEVDGLINVNLYTDAVAYAKEMCRKYPHTEKSWLKLCEIKFKIDPEYPGIVEYKNMCACPDYNGTLPTPIAIKQSSASKHKEEYTKEKTSYIDKFLYSSLIFCFMPIFMLFIVPLAGIVFMVFVGVFFSAIGAFLAAKEHKKDYKALQEALPLNLPTIDEGIKKSKKPFFSILFLILGIIIYLFVIKKLFL